MTVAAYNAPNNTTMDAATYKGSIDGAFAVLCEIGQDFAPHQTAPTGMAVMCDAGTLMSPSGALVQQAMQTSSAITAPASGYARIDRMVINAATGALSIVTGTPATGTPAPPAIPVGFLPCAQVSLSSSTAVITNNLITDERTAFVSGAAMTSAANNVVLGFNALSAVLTGTNNTVVGVGAGAAITTGSNNVCVGENSGNDAMVSLTTQSNTVVLGNNSTTTLYCKTGTITTTSDLRDKINIADLDRGLDFVNQLRPVSYRFKDRQTHEIQSGRRFGFIAQEVLQLEGRDNILINADDPDHLKIGEALLVPILVKAVQELSARLDALTAS